MTSLLKWEKSSADTNPINSAAGEDTEFVVYLSRLGNNSEESLQKAVQETVDKAISLFDINVLDDSRYFICEWDDSNLTLTVVVSDDTKQVDSKYIVKCRVSALEDERNAQEDSENVKYWISNYLTTHADFMQYSLIALFHNDSRDKTQLL